MSELQFNATPPPTVTTSAPDEVYNTSELSLVIDKADSIEEEPEEVVHASVRHKKTFSCDDIVIEEEAPVSSSESIESSRIKKVSVVAMETEKASSEINESLPRQQSQPIEALQLPPTTTSTQTIPTEEFPEVSVTSTAINQADDFGDNAQLKEIETQQDTNVAQEIDMKMKEFRSRSINERDGNSDGSANDQQQKQSFLAHQQSMSQEADDEVAMVSGLLPGCVAPAPTPAPSIAPLAEIEVDPTEDDADAPEQGETVETKPDVERKKKRKEKREKEGGECHSQAQGEAADSSTHPEKSKRNAVCPWEDE